jgi:choline dehydrogenase-like flavoprotein
VKDGRATGVEFEQNGKISTANTEKEVILSAGAFQSPQILMLSGIGDRKELESLGIEVTHHLPGVGKNLQEHVWSGTTGLSNLRSANSDHQANKPIESPSAILFSERKGRCVMDLWKRMLL